MISNALRNELQFLLAVRPQTTAAEFEALCAEWDIFYRRLGVDPADQLADFRATMRARVRVGVVSIRPDDLDRVFAVPPVPKVRGMEHEGNVDDGGKPWRP